MTETKLGHAFSVAVWRGSIAAILSTCLLILAIVLTGDSKFLWLPIINIPISACVLALSGFLSGLGSASPENESLNVGKSTLIDEPK
jgi:hypothetical protein